jgi:hypothetical protein
MKTCETCGGPLNRGGHSGGDGATCFACRSDRTMQSFSFPKRVRPYDAQKAHDRYLVRKGKEVQP